MSDAFTGVTAAGNSKSPTAQWTIGTVAPTPQTFVPFQSTGQPGSDEVGYGEDGYGSGGYDTPSVPAVNSPGTNWTLVSSK